MPPGKRVLLVCVRVPGLGTQFLFHSLARSWEEMLLQFPAGPALPAVTASRDASCKEGVQKLPKPCGAVCMGNMSHEQLLLCLG